MSKDQKTVDKLKELIDENGPDYLTAEPYETYKELIKSGTEPKLAGALLHTLARGIEKSAKESRSKEELSKAIQKECSLNKSMAVRLSELFSALYSPTNSEEWQEKKLEGWQKFVSAELEAEWDGESVWDNGGVHVDCDYSAEIVLEPEEDIKPDKQLAEELTKNPFMKAEDISAHYHELLLAFLDGEFEDYCTSDDYYPPVAEDFEIDDYVKDWCKIYGFSLVSCDGSGSTGDYEPNEERYGRRWY